MNYTNINNLSMTGGDDFSEINVILDGVVYKALTQTITGDKTFTGTTIMDGALEMNGITTNTNTFNNLGLMLNNNDIENQGTIVNTATGSITNDGLFTNSSVGTITNNGLITNSALAVITSAGLFTNNGNLNNENVITLAVGSSIDTDGKTITPAEVGYLDGVVSDIQPQINLKANDNAVVHLVGTETITGAKTFENDNFTVRTATLGDRIAVNSTTITITPSTTTGITMTPTLYQSDFTTGYSFFTNAVEKLALSATESFLRNATNVFLQIGTTTKHQITAIATTLTNTTTTIVSGVLTKLSINATDTTLTNATSLTMTHPTTTIVSGANTKMNITGTDTTLTNDTINLTGSTGVNISNTTGAMRFWSPTMSFGYDTLLNNICSVMTFESLGGYSIGFNLDPLNFGNFNISDNTTQYVAIDNTGMYLQNAEVYVDGSTVIRLDSPQNIITNTAGSNTLDALTTGTNTIRSVSGANTITSTTGRNTLTTANTTTTANLITATGALGGNTMRTTTGSNLLSVSSTSTSNTGENFLEVAGGNGGNVLKAIGAGTGAGGYNSIIGRNNYYDASVGKHYIRTGATGSETNRIVVSTTEVNINNALGTEGYYLGTSGALTLPLISFALTLFPNTSNTTASQLSVGFSNADPANVIRTFRAPYKCRVVGWSVNGDAEAHNSLSLQFRVSNALANGATGTGIYWNQTNTLNASDLTSSSASANQQGNIYGFATPPGAGLITQNDISAGTQMYFYETTSATMLCEMVFQVFFQQIL